MPKIKQSHPYQLAELVCYDLNKTFGRHPSMYATQSLQQPNLIIPKDPILETQACKQYEKFRIEDLKMDTFLENKKGLDAKFVKNYQSLNSDYSLGYYKTGLHY